MNRSMIEFFVFLLVFTVMVVSATLIFDRGSCHQDSDMFRCVTYVDNYDADTITVNIPGVHPLLGEGAKIRLRGIDTPELRGSSACEKRKAMEARDYVRGRLVGKTLRLYDIERGKYFRIVADLVFDGISLSEELIAKGYGYRYDGGKKEKKDWCHELL